MFQNRSFLGNQFWTSNQILSCWIWITALEFWLSPDFYFQIQSFTFERKLVWLDLENWTVGAFSNLDFWLGSEFSPQISHSGKSYQIYLICKMELSCKIFICWEGVRSLVLNILLGIQFSSNFSVRSQNFTPESWQTWLIQENQEKVRIWFQFILCEFWYPLIRDTKIKI